MKKTFLALVLMAVILISLPGCSNPSQNLGESIKNLISGDVVGELNKSYSTKWFDFTVKSIKTAYEYGDYEVYDGYKYVIVAVIETNTFHAPIPMSAYDFIIDADNLDEEDSYPLEAFEDDMMPDEFELAVGETVEYNVIFIIPDDITDIRFIYEEIDEEGNSGATFTVRHSI